jgi:hypothetical protein
MKLIKPYNLGGCSVGVIDGRDSWSTPLIFHQEALYIPSFVTICSGVKVILRLLPQQFERLQCWYNWWDELWIVPLRWLQVACYAYQVSWRPVQAFKVITSTILLLLMGRIYAVCRWDGLRWHDILTRFHKDRFRRSKVVREGDARAQTAMWSS